MFLTSKKPKGLYKILVNTCKKDNENILGEKLSLDLISRKKTISLKYILKLIFFCLSGKILINQHCLRFKYNSINIGRFALSETLKNPRTYENKIIFIIIFLKNLIKSGQILSTCKNYDKVDIKGIFLDHCFYLNGIYYSFFIKKRIFIYTNNFPTSILRVNPRKKKVGLNLVENLYKLPFEIKNLKKKKNKISNKISQMTKKPKKFLPWLKNTKYHKITSNRYYDYNYVIYCHSFTDAQLIYGDDGFSSTYEWLIFTLNFLKQQNAKVIIKPHPNFWNSYLIGKDSNIDFDRRIYENILLKYNNVKNFLFLDRAISNFELMKKLNKKCILVSHHGSVIFEASIMNFKTIFSEATFYSKKYKVTNSWNSKKEYQKLLKKKWTNLKFSKTKDLYMLFDKYFYDDHSYYGKYYWQKILCNHLNMDFVEFTKKIEDTPDKIIPNSEIKNLVKKTLKSIADVN